MGVLAPSVTEQVPMTIGAFRAFQMGRPDGETWELVDGMPVMMMTPAHLGHARIAGNIERLLSDALDVFDPRRMALHDIGVDLGLAAETLSSLGQGARYAPQPDVGVIDAAYAADQRFATRLYVAVEVVSETDNAWVASRKMRWIEAKTQLYQAHRHCEAVIVVEQDRVEVRLSLRSGGTWLTERLTEWKASISLPTCGLICAVGDFYRGTPLDPDRVRRKA